MYGFVKGILALSSVLVIVSLIAIRTQAIFLSSVDNVVDFSCPVAHHHSLDRVPSQQQCYCKALFSPFWRQRGAIQKEEDESDQNDF